MKKIFIIIFIVFMMINAKAQMSAVRINALALMTGTLNIAFDVKISPKYTLDFSLYLNPISVKAYRSKGVLLSFDLKRWHYQPHVGPFWGICSTYSKYDFGDDVKYYKGFMIGLGTSYGYSILLSNRLNLTIEGGLGLFFMKDKKQRYKKSGYNDVLIYHYRRLIVAPIKLEIGFSYLF